MITRKVYLDHSATTPARPEVVEAMKPYFTDIFGNASSLHGFGQESRKALADARESIAALIGAKADEIVFTGCGTESDNMALKGVAWANKDKGNHIITTQIEHHAILYTCEYLETQGFKVTYLEVDKNGRLDPQSVRKAMTPHTILVSVMHANNEVGAIQPIKEIGQIIAAENANRNNPGMPQVYFHTDAVQSAGKIKLNVNELKVDLLSVSAHKFYGPKGVGMLYVRRGTNMTPLFHGGHHEHNRRAGTENTAGIVGMAKALEMSNNEMEVEQSRQRSLRDGLEKGIVAAIPEVSVNGAGEGRVANVLNCSFQAIEGEGLLLSLDLEGIAVSTGSACASGSSEPSHVLKAMCVDTALAQGTVRFSLGRHTSDEDITYVLEVLPRVVARLRSMSPLWKRN
jgi:cysteine desulfurase